MYPFSLSSSYDYKRFRNVLFKTLWYSDRTVIFVLFVLWSLWKVVSMYVEIALHGFIFELWFVWQGVSAYVGSKIKFASYSWFSEKDFVTYVGGIRLLANVLFVCSVWQQKSFWVVLFLLSFYVDLVNELPITPIDWCLSWIYLNSRTNLCSLFLF